MKINLIKSITDTRIAIIIDTDKIADIDLIFVSNLKSYKFIKEAVNKGPD